MISNVKIDLTEFNRTIARYAVMARRTVGEVLPRVAKDTGFFLYGTFKKIAPSPYLIDAEARARNFGFKQRLSPRAYEFAASAMGGQKSVWGKVSYAGKHPILRLIRIGKKGKRIAGGRRGRGGVAASYKQGKDGLAMDGERPMNVTAVANFYEMMLRRRGIKSLAVAWLPAIKQKVSAKEAAAGVQRKYVMNNQNATVKWASTYELNTGRDAAQALLTTDAPGMEKYTHLVQKGVNYAQQNMLVYINGKLREALTGEKFKNTKENRVQIT